MLLIKFIKIFLYCHCTIFPYRWYSHSMENGTKENFKAALYECTVQSIEPQTSVVLADLLYKTKLHYSKDRTMRGPPVYIELYSRVGLHWSRYGMCI